MNTEEQTLRESPLRAENEKLAARLAGFLGCRLPISYGQNTDVASEVRMARESVAVVDTNFRGFLSLSGADRARYLNAVTTADIKNISEGQGNVGLLLNPQGHILAEIETYSLPDALLLVSHAFTLDRTRETLDRFIIMDDCTLEDVSARYSSIGLGGPQATKVLESLCGLALAGLSAWSHVQASITGTPCRIVRHSFYGSEDNLPGFEILAEPEKLSLIWQRLVAATGALGGGPIGLIALNSLRLDSGIPWFGWDYDEKVLPHEAGIEISHISYTKGCYTGQEIIERVRSRGHVNRRLVMLEFSRAEAIMGGMALSAAGKEVGHITSVAFSFKRNKSIGMGYVRREHAQSGSRLEFPGGTAEVFDLSAIVDATPRTSCS